MEDYNNLKQKIKTKYKKLFDIAQNVYKNPKIFEELPSNEQVLNDHLFNEFIIDLNSCEYPEEFERCIIYQHPINGIQCSNKDSSKIMHLARYIPNRPEIDFNLDITPESCKYLTFSYRDIENQLSGYVFIFGMYYIEKQTEFNPESPIYGCTFSLNPLYYDKNEQRDIGISAINSPGNEKCKTIIFKSFFIEPF
jgi:hypothetical protein